jgi:hypothetical protein
MTNDRPLYRFRTAPKDLGVAIVTLVALAAGWLLFARADGATRQFQAQDAPFRIAYPAEWLGVESLADALLKVEDPRADSAFKTSMIVESRELDPQSPPTIQTLMDRRIEQRGQLTGYHFLSNQDTTVGGAKAAEIEYAYVVQPIDQPRRASLPVVVRAREYIVVAADRTYYITLAAPENEFERASIGPRPPPKRGNSGEAPRGYPASPEPLPRKSCH